jgi:chaperonin GroES
MIELEMAKILETDNVASLLDEGDKSKISSDLSSSITSDIESMSDWKRKYDKALKLARMKDDGGDKTFPFVGASRVMMPYVMEAALDFNARVSPDILGRKNICQISEVGKTDDETGDRADRVSTYINWELTQGIVGWQDAQDKAFILLPIVGTYFKKNWYCPIEEKQKCSLVFPDKLILDHNSNTFESVQRKTFEFKLTRNEVVGKINNESYDEIDLDAVEYGQLIDFKECHCSLDLDGDGYEEPYIVTIHEGTSDIVSIVKRFDDMDIKRSEDDKDITHIDEEEFFTCTIFLPDPNATFMGMGWGIVLSDLYDTINTGIRQLLDAGTLQNTGSNSGFINGSLIGGRTVNRQQKGKIEMIMGQYTQLQGEGNIRDNIMNFPFAGPSPVMFQLIEYLTTKTKELTMKTNIQAQPNEAAEMYLARLSEASKSPTSIKNRVYRGLTGELKRIYGIAERYLTDEKYKEILNYDEGNVKSDFEKVSYDIYPTANPALGSEQEQIQKATLVKNDAMAYPVPGVYNVRTALKDYYKALGLSDDQVSGVLPEPEPNQPDPILMAQVQAQQQLAQAETLKGQADMMNAEAKMLQAHIDMAKMAAEIEEIESKTIKNLSSVEKDQQDSMINTSRSMLETMQKNFDMTRGAFDELNRINQPQYQQAAIETVATQPGNDSV